MEIPQVDPNWRFDNQGKKKKIYIQHHGRSKSLFINYIFHLAPNKGS